MSPRRLSGAAHSHLDICGCTVVFNVLRLYLNVVTGLLQCLGQVYTDANTAHKQLNNLATANLQHQQSMHAWLHTTGFNHLINVSMIINLAVT